MTSSYLRHGIWHDFIHHRAEESFWVYACKATKCVIRGVNIQVANQSAVGYHSSLWRQGRKFPGILPADPQKLPFSQPSVAPTARQDNAASPIQPASSPANQSRGLQPLAQSPSLSSTHPASAQETSTEIADAKEQRSQQALSNAPAQSSQPRLNSSTIAEASIEDLLVELERRAEQESRTVLLPSLGDNDTS